MFECKPLMDGALQQLLSPDENPEMRAKLISDSNAPRDRVDLDVSAAAATVPHWAKTQDAGADTFHCFSYTKNRGRSNDCRLSVGYPQIVSTQP